MLRLRGAFSTNPRLAPLLDGAVSVPGVEIAWETIEPNVAFLHHLQANDFDVFEFSIANYLITRAQTDRWNWTALPIFLSKAGPVFGARVGPDSEIQEPRDLRGKRFGLLEYGMTAGLWLRAMLYSLYQIEPAEMQWFVDGSRDGVLGVREHLAFFRGVTFLDQEGAVGELLQSGALDAAFLTGAPPVGDRSHPLLTDGGRAFLEAFFRATGCTPVNHTVVMQRRVADENPGVAEALYTAIEAAKQEAYRRDRAARAVFRDGTDLDWQAEVFGDDPYPSGLAANRAMLTLAAEQSVRDGLTPGAVAVDGLFHTSLGET